MPFTDTLITFAALPGDHLSPRALTLARFSLLDWIACGRAGRTEPVAQHLHSLAASEGGAETASLFTGLKAPARMAALANGAASHGLDYDDTHFGHIGHLSVGIYPAALAIAESIDAPAQSMVEAFLIGAEGAIRIGIMLGKAHDLLGFHQTATAGAFGATIAAGRLLQLTPEQMRHALGLCATKASGLRSQFGTMGKPYNAGLAAATGVECAQLAQLGMTSADDGMFALQGFVASHTSNANPEAGWANSPPGTFLFEDNKYKVHACCHGTHAMIEALLSSDALTGQPLTNIASIRVHTHSRWLHVCDVKAPRTGLEVKFSYVWLAGMALRGDQTGNDRTYTDALAQDPELADFAQKIEVIGDDTLTDAQARLTVTLRSGDTIKAAYDLDAPLPEQILQDKLQSKATALLGDEGTRLWTRFPDLSTVSARDLGEVLRSGA